MGKSWQLGCSYIDSYTYIYIYICCVFFFFSFNYLVLQLLVLSVFSIKTSRFFSRSQR